VHAAAAPSGASDASPNQTHFLPTCPLAVVCYSGLCRLRRERLSILYRILCEFRTLYDVSCPKRSVGIFKFTLSRSRVRVLFRRLHRPTGKKSRARVCAFAWAFIRGAGVAAGWVGLEKGGSGITVRACVCGCGG